MPHPEGRDIFDTGLKGEIVLKPLHKGGSGEPLTGRLSRIVMPLDARAGIAAALEEVLGRPVSITDDTSIVKDLGLDSLAVMNFIMALEDEYDISMPLDRIAEVDTVGDLARAVETLRNKAPK